MVFGNDFFKVLQLVVAILRVWGRIMGDKDDRKNDDAVQGNHCHECDKVIANMKVPPEKK